MSLIAAIRSLRCAAFSVYQTAPKKVHQTMQQTQTVLWICWAWDQWIEGKIADKPPRWTKVDEVPPLRRVAR